MKPSQAEATTFPAAGNPVANRVRAFPIKKLLARTKPEPETLAAQALRAVMTKGK